MDQTYFRNIILMKRIIYRENYLMFDVILDTQLFTVTVTCYLISVTYYLLPEFHLISATCYLLPVTYYLLPVT